jgi:hypothetical protein
VELLLKCRHTTSTARDLRTCLRRARTTRQERLPRPHWPRAYGCRAARPAAASAGGRGADAGLRPRFSRASSAAVKARLGLPGGKARAASASIAARAANPPAESSHSSQSANTVACCSASESDLSPAMTRTRARRAGSPGVLLLSCLVAIAQRFPHARSPQPAPPASPAKATCQAWGDATARSSPRRRAGAAPS